MKGRQAVEEYAVGVSCGSEHGGIDLIGFQQVDPFFHFGFFTHGDPYIGVDNITAIDTIFYGVGNGDLATCSAGDIPTCGHQFFIGEE